MVRVNQESTISWKRWTSVKSCYVGKTWHWYSLGDDIKTASWQRRRSSIPIVNSVTGTCFGAKRIMRSYIALFQWRCIVTMVLVTRFQSTQIAREGALRSFSNIAPFSRVLFFYNKSMDLAEKFIGKKIPPPVKAEVFERFWQENLQFC